MRTLENTYFSVGTISDMTGVSVAELVEEIKNDALEAWIEKESIERDGLGADDIGVRGDDLVKWLMSRRDGADIVYRMKERTREMRAAAERRK